MKKKFRILSQPEEAKRANDTLLKGTCFITNVLLNDQPYDLVWHAGAHSWVFVSEPFIINKKETLNE